MYAFENIILSRASLTKLVLHKPDKITFIMQNITVISKVRLDKITNKVIWLK